MTCLHHNGVGCLTSLHSAIVYTRISAGRSMGTTSGLKMLVAYRFVVSMVDEESQRHVKQSLPEHHLHV